MKDVAGKVHTALNGKVCAVNIYMLLILPALSGHSLDQVESILCTLDLLPLDWSYLRDLSRGESNAGKMDKT